MLEAAGDVDILVNNAAARRLAISETGPVDME